MQPRELMMPSEALVQELRGRLPDEFHRQLLDGSLQALQQTNNPMRGHLVAAGLRELFGLTLETLAPDEMVTKCAWFRQAPDVNGPTRRQRALYATRGGLHDDFLRGELKIAPEELHDDLGKAFAELNKRTHVRPETLMVDAAEIDAFAEGAITALNDVFVSIYDLRQDLAHAIEGHLQREAMDALVRETVPELDLLAGHHSIEAVYTDQMQVTGIDAEFIHYEARGDLDVELQWGSSSDFEKGDGATMDQSFPFKCRTAAPADRPYSFNTALTEVAVDTSEWFDKRLDD